MITAIVLINAEMGRVPELAERLVEIPQVSEVYSVTGGRPPARRGRDLVALIRVARHEQLAELVPRTIANLPGITRTRTFIAFEAFSRRDLEAMWSVGLQESGGEVGEKGPRPRRAPR
jgi:DNA-binding Lrp family transcriptional regulator